MASKRRILLDELDSWRAEGVMDEATHAFLRGRKSVFAR